MQACYLHFLLRRTFFALSITFLLLILHGCSLIQPRPKWQKYTRDDIRELYNLPSHQDFLEFETQHLAGVQRLELLFATQGIIFPVEQVLHQGSSWREFELLPYAMPPDSLWPLIIPTLKLLQEEIIPLVGEVEIVSGFRTPGYNELAGGASRSRHLFFQAVDVVPLTQIPERKLKKRLRKFWYKHGEQYNLGLGLYDYTRFHIDTWKYRNWGDWPGE